MLGGLGVLLEKSNDKLLAGWFRGDKKVTTSVKAVSLRITTSVVPFVASTSKLHRLYTVKQQQLRSVFVVVVWGGLSTVSWVFRRLN